MGVFIFWLFNALDARQDFSRGCIDTSVRTMEQDECVLLCLLVGYFCCCCCCCCVGGVIIIFFSVMN